MFCFVSPTLEFWLFQSNFVVPSMAFRILIAKLNVCIETSRWDVCNVDLCVWVLPHVPHDKSIRLMVWKEKMWQLGFGSWLANFWTNGCQNFVISWGYNYVWVPAKFKFSSDFVGVKIITTNFFSWLAKWKFQFIQKSYECETSKWKCSFPNSAVRKK